MNKTLRVMASTLFAALAAAVCYAGVQPAGGEYTGSLPSGEVSITVGTSAPPFACPAWVGEGGTQTTFDDEAGRFGHPFGDGVEWWEFIPPHKLKHGVDGGIWGVSWSEEGDYEPKHQ